jgi:hypothetical protein
MSGIFSRKNWDFKLDSNNRIVYVRFWGETFSKEIIKINKKLIDEHEIIGGFNWIFDMSKSKVLFSVNQIEKIANIFKTNSDLFHDIKMAIIIGNPKHSLSVDALIRFFNTHHIDIKVRKVIDNKQAFDWIKYDRI